MTENGLTEHIENPICDMHLDCFANSDGRCECLIMNDFGDRDCPFYKDRLVYLEEKKRLEKRVNW